MKLNWFKNTHLSIRCSLHFSQYNMLWCSVCGCLSIHTERRGVHIRVYTSQRLPITLIKFHTAQGDSVRPDQIANISWLKYMFAKRLERKKINTDSENTQSGGWERGEDPELNHCDAAVCCNGSCVHVCKEIILLTPQIIRRVFSHLHSPYLAVNCNTVY